MKEHKSDYTALSKTKMQKFNKLNNDAGKECIKAVIKSRKRIKKFVIALALVLSSLPMAAKTILQDPPIILLDDLLLP